MKKKDMHLETTAAIATFGGTLARDEATLSSGSVILHFSLRKFVGRVIAE